MKAGDACRVRDHTGEVIDAVYIGPHRCALTGDEKSHMVQTMKFGPLWPCVASRAKPWFDSYGPDYHPRVRFVAQTT